MFCCPEVSAVSLPLLLPVAAQPSELSGGRLLLMLLPDEALGCPEADAVL